MLESFENLDKILEEVSRLKKSHELLEKIWLAHGPYQEQYISKELWYKVNDHFGFNDSE